MNFLGKEIGDGQKTFLIAEAGVNHNGKIDVALKMADVAKACGADAVKFQKRDLQSLYRADCLREPSNESHSLGVYIPILRECELSEIEHAKLKDHCEAIGIKYLCSPWDLPSLYFLVHDLKVEGLKLPSACLSDSYLLQAVIDTNLPVILSTGMHCEQEIRDIMELIDSDAFTKNVPGGTPHKQTVISRHEQKTENHMPLWTTCQDKWPRQLSPVSREIYTALAEIASTHSSAEEANDLPFLYTRLRQAGETQEEALRNVRIGKGPGALLRLQSTPPGSMALQEPSPQNSSSSIKQRIALMHCISSYPTANRDVNLGYMRRLKDLFSGIPVGYSGHERGVPISVAAVALGANIIERHFTLDRTWKGPDHAASLEPHGLEELVRHVRAVEEALGERKNVNQGEVVARETLGKALSWADDYPAGTTLTPRHFVALSPGYGVPPYKAHAAAKRGDIWITTTAVKKGFLVRMEEVENKGSSTPTPLTKETAHVPRN